jgi:uncharacterized membrane protein YgcG
MAAASIGNYKKQTVPVADLQLDLENFRTGNVADQNGALAVLISRSANKLRGLITSIVENGFLDLETPCVFPDATKKGKYVVAEGNRRVSALKIIRTPELAKNTPLMAEVKKLKDVHHPKLPTQIECAVFATKKDCLAYILMRHGYGTDGAGVIQWNSISKLRADTYVNGTVHQELKVLEFVVQDGKLSEKRQQVIDDDEVNITNLARITDDLQVRSLLGVIGGDCTKSSHGHDWLLKVWQRIVEIIIDGVYKGEKFTVDKNINNTAQRQEFIKEIIDEVHPPKTSGGSTSSGGSSGTGASTSGSGAGTTGSGGATPGKGGAKPQPTRSRKSLIPKNFNPPGLKPQKIVNICEELRKLEVKNFPHCAGAMFRILVEFGVENYITLNPTIVPKNDKLVSKIAAVVQHMETGNILTKKQLKPVKDIIGTVSHPISTETLNAYVHNPHVSPNADTLKTEWDNIQHFMELLWSK